MKDEGNERAKRNTWVSFVMQQFVCIHFAHFIASMLEFFQKAFIRFSNRLAPFARSPSSKETGVSKILPFVGYW